MSLIKKVEDYQKNSIIPKKSDKFLLSLENSLQNSGCIGPRKPAARKGNITAKPSYIRDEPKLWTKLGLMELKGKKQYFFPNEGYKFNWNIISDALVEGQRILSV